MLGTSCRACLSKDSEGTQRERWCAIIAMFFFLRVMPRYTCTSHTPSCAGHQDSGKFPLCAGAPTASASERHDIHGLCAGEFEHYQRNSSALRIAYCLFVVFYIASSPSTYCRLVFDIFPLAVIIQRGCVEVVKQKMTILEHDHMTQRRLIMMALLHTTNPSRGGDPDTPTVPYILLVWVGLLC